MNILNAIVDEEKLDAAIIAIMDIVKDRPEQKKLPVRFDNGFFKKEEGYKYEVHEAGRKVLNLDSWSKESIGSGEISQVAIRSISKGKNLVHFATDALQKKLENNEAAVDKIFYNLYKGNADKAAFEELTQRLGRNYARTAYWFFLKDKENYLPMGAANKFQNAFKWLNISTVCVDKCTWENYQEFIGIIRYIQGKLIQHGFKETTLLDAHTFVWCSRIAQEQLDVINGFHDYSEGKINISVAEWEALLKDPEVFTEENINLIAKYYIAPGHSSTCRRLADEEGTHPSSYISKIVSIGKRTYKKLDMEPSVGADGNKDYWVVPFIGRQIIKGLWEFKLRNELVEAFENTCQQYIVEATERKNEREAYSVDDEILEERAKVGSSDKVAFTEVIMKRAKRNPYIAEWAKRVADGWCQLCDERTPFNGKDGRPYLESHHIVPIAEGGADSIDNIIALCPNCHKKMHIVGDRHDIAFLRDCAEGYAKRGL